MRSQDDRREKFKEPSNEKGVFYLFSRNHEELGFSEIVEFIDGTPDLRAVRNGEKVGVELEMRASAAFRHYCALNEEKQGETIMGFPRGEWEKDGSVWKYVYHGETKMSFEEEAAKSCDVEPSCKYLLFKSAKSVGIDIIVHWEQGEWFKFWKWDREVMSFPLKTKLQEIRRI
jgi:hypothetical protein